MCEVSINLVRRPTPSNHVSTLELTFLFVVESTSWYLVALRQSPTMATNSETPVWELSKENAAPLQRGRNVAALEQALVESDETRAFKERSVERFEGLVQPSEQGHLNANSEAASVTDDPLVHWLGYIKFHQESYPSNTHDQFLLMERCFRALCRFRRYANDVRFIRLCCQYAEKTERPNEIFQHLYKQEIGVETAIFWIAWGFIAEKREDWSFANNVYAKGIKKKAKPLEKLTKRYQQFQRRMARKWMNHSQIQEDADGASSNRGVLGSLSDEAFHRNDRSSSRPAGPSFLSHSSTEPNTQNRQGTFVDRSAPSRTKNDSNQPAGAAFPIFVEDGGDTDNPLDNPMLQPDGRYRQIEREQDRKKENVHAAERWNERGAYAPSYPKARAVPKTRSGNPPPFAVYVDEECAAQQRKEESQRERQNETHRRARDDRTFREREDLSVGDSLLKDPLRYVMDPSRLEADKRAAKPQTSNPLAAIAGTKRKANAGFSTRLLRHPDTGEEQSFEEARALAEYYKLVCPSTNVNLLIVTPESNDSMPVEEESSDDDDVSMTEATKCPSIPKRPFGSRRKSLMIPQNRSIDIPTPQNASTASSTADDGKASEFQRADPTIHSKMALQELSMMFSSPAVGLNDSAVCGALNRTGGLGPILNESGVSEPAEDRSMVVIQENKELEANAFQIFDENAMSEYMSSPQPKAAAPEFAIFNDTESTTQKEFSNETSVTANNGENITENPAVKKRPRAFGIHCDSVESTSETNPDGLADDPCANVVAHGDSTDDLAVFRENSDTNELKVGTLGVVDEDNATNTLFRNPNVPVGEDGGDTATSFEIDQLFDDFGIEQGTSENKSKDSISK